MISLVHALAENFIIIGLVCETVLLGYLWLFALVYFFINRRDISVIPEPRFRFVFIVPAHDEEIGIADTVQSLLEVCYPRTLFDVVVVADNCSDGTAEKARTAGVECLERRDPNLRGKGYALSYAFTELLPRGYDAFIVIDADSIISTNFLFVLNSRLSQGEKVIQAYYGLSNPDASILTYLFQVGNLLENKLFWEPKQALKLPIILRGNGMCFAREVLEQYPWNAFSIVEDTEYGLLLSDHGIHIHFASEIGVYARQPETLGQAFAQRVRWASGNSTLTKKRSFSLIGLGAMQRKFALIDLGITLMVGSRPLLLIANIALLGLSFAFGPKAIVYWAALSLVAHVLYIGLGVMLNGFSLQKMARLILSPFYLGWLCVVSLLGLAGFRKKQWIRTTRSL